MIAVAKDSNCTMQTIGNIDAFQVLIPKIPETWLRTFPV